MPYRGAGPAMQDMLAGQVDLLVVQAAAALPQVRAGTVKILANLSPRARPWCPTSRPRRRAACRDSTCPGWFGLFAPKGTPKDVIARLNAAMVQALADPAVRKTLLGPRPRRRLARAADARRARRFHKAEIEKWWPIIRAAGIKAE